MWLQDRWFGLFTPGRSLEPFDAIASALSAQPSVAAYFVRLDSGFDVSTLTKFGARGLTPFLTLEPWLNGMSAGGDHPSVSLSQLNAGAHDDDLLRIAQVLADFNAPVYLRLAHEMNGHWYPWAVGQNGNTAGDYLQFWSHVRTIFKIASKVQWVFGCAAIQGLRMGAPALETVYPGDDLVDLVGTTGYGWDVDAQATYGRTFAKLATISNRDFVIPEMGAQQPVNASGTLPATWTASFGRYLLATPRIRGFVWFDIDPSIGATGDYRLNDPATIASLNQVFMSVPIVSNTAMTPAGSSVLVTPTSSNGFNPTSGVYARNVVKGFWCDAKGPARGFDKYGNPYECHIDPRGWNRWVPLASGPEGGTDGTPTRS